MTPVAKSTGSIARNTLVKIAMRVALVIIVMTMIAYYHVVSVITEQSVEQLDKYITERGHRDSAIFQLAEDNHARLKEEVFTRLARYGNQDPKERFDKIFTRFPDGVIRNRLEGFDGTKEAFAYIGTQAKIDADLRRQLLIYLDLSNQYGPAWHHRLQNVYFTTPDNILVGYWPQVPDWAHGTSADYYMPDEEFIWVVDKKHNPSRKTVWTGLFYDKPSGAWMVSVETPLDLNEKHIGSVGHDILLNELLERTINDNLKGAYNFIFRNDGRLIAHPNKMDVIKKAAGYYDLNTSKDSQLKDIYDLVMQNQGKSIIEDSNQAAYLAVTQIKQPGWHFVTVYPKQLITAPAFETAQIILILGVASLLLELLIMFWILRDSVAGPLNSLVTAVDRFSDGEEHVQLNITSDDEIGILGKTFNAMTSTIAGHNQKLEQERNLSEQILEKAGALMVVMDNQGKVIRFNQACEQATGYSSEEIEGKMVWDFLLREEEIEPVKNVFNNLVTSSLPSQKENYWVTKDGEDILISWSNTITTDSNGNISSVIALGQDITGQRMLEQAINLQAQVIDQIHDSVVSTDLDGYITSWNKGAESMFGFSKTEMIGKHISIVYPKDKQEFLATDVIAPLKQKGTHEIEVTMLNKSGNTFCGHLSLSMLLDDTGKAYGMIGYTMDITEKYNVELELKQLNEELELRVEERTQQLKESITAVNKENDERKRAEQSLIIAKEEAIHANKLKSEFLGRMSHELRTPMNAIIGFGQLISLEKISPKVAAYIKEVNDASNHLLGLIDEVLELSTIEAGKIKINIRSYHLCDIIDESISLVTSDANKRSITIINSLASDNQINVSVDKLRFKEIILNLLSNAIKYINEGGKISIRCEAAGKDKICLEVSDDGPGIAKEKQETLFEPFNRLGAEYSEVEGTGIGLTISKQLIENMGGKIGVISEPGNGTTFWLECPLATGEDQDLSDDIRNDNKTSRTNVQRVILYVEDNPANMKLIEEVFAKDPKIKLLKATNAEDGLQLARQNTPDIIILDLNLPGMDGYEALAKLRKTENTKHTPAFALSAAAMPRDVERGLHAGFERYLTKPIRITDLREAVNKTLSSNTSHLN